MKKDSARLAAPCLGLTLLGAAVIGLAGCGSLFTEGSAAGAGIAGTALANQVTRNATVAAGIGLSVQAAARAGVQYTERITHRDEQDRIAAAAGPLAVGALADWHREHLIKLDPDQHGRGTVSRVISSGTLDCKEIVFSVDTLTKQKTPTRAFYVATVWRDGALWKWASAEPATERWGALQ